MKVLPSNVERLISEFGKLPGVGPKLAERLTFSLLRGDESALKHLGTAVSALKEGITLCGECTIFAEAELCNLCGSEGRDRGLICVVEDPLDVVAIEKTGRFTGLYHVLHGSLSPVEGVGPSELKIKELGVRIGKGEVKELILATNPSLEGEATALFIQRLFAKSDLIITRLAAGLPIGGDLEYADELTLTRALEGRRPI